MVRMRSPVQVWSAAPLKNTTKTSCFFNVCKVFCTHLHNFFEIVREACRLRSSPADGVSACKQSLIFACRLNYPAKLHAATACRFCVRPAHRCKNFAGGFVGGVRGFLLPAISVSSLAVSSSMVYFVIGDCRRRYCLFGFSTL